MTTFDAIEALHHILDDVQTITPIGHHQLKRHLVYQVDLKHKSVVVKFYFKENRWNREVATLQILKKQGLDTPKLLDYGQVVGVEYLVMEYMDGTSLKDARIDDFEINKDITYEAGKQLAMIHKENKKHKFGILNDDTSWKSSFDTWYDFFMYEASRHLENVVQWNHSNPELIDRGVGLFYELVRDIKDKTFEACLIHNDISERNIFVCNNAFVTLIDYEQSCISERYRELVLVEYHMNRYRDGLFAAFLKGYTSVYNVEEEKLYQYKDLYLLHYGISICSWSQLVDPNYYNEGLNMIQDIITKYE